MRTIFFLFLIFCSGFNLLAQPYIDIFSVHYQRSPDAALFGKGKNPFATDYLNANINLPVKVFKHDRLLINPVFEWNKLTFIKQDSTNINLYGITLALSYVKQWKNEKWKTVLVSVNRISSDLKNITIKHYQPGVAVLMIYERSEKIKYKLGAFYNAEFFGPFILPLIGVEWKISKRFILHGLVPRNLALEYKITPSLYVGLNWKAITNSFRYQSDNTNDYFKIEESQIRLFADIYITKHLVFNIEAGHSFLREYNAHLNSPLYENNERDFNLLANEGLLFKAGLYYRIRLDEKK